MQYDLIVVGGGINGAGIARDAAGRGLAVALAERGDFAGQTSSASSKLIHGGLRYLEHYEFRLVAESLAEREILLAAAPHLVWPSKFVMPYVPELRPRWMIRAGLFLYDRLAHRSALAASASVRLDRPPYNAGLRAGLKHGFVYSDCRVDDARLVLANVTDAAARGATILARNECIGARAHNGLWQVSFAGGEMLTARVLVNAAGPWAKTVLNDRLGQPSADRLQLVKGSHVVLPRLYEGAHAFILQNDDGRVVFMIPFEERFTLLGTTEVAMDAADHPTASAAEIGYLCGAASRYLARSVKPEEAVWSFAGVRPLYDDGSEDLSAVTRDYTLRLDHEQGRAPVLSVFGGKLTTYRRLAEKALHKLAPYFPHMKADWTARALLPGADFGNAEEAQRELAARYPGVPEAVRRAVFRRHGSHTARVLGDGLTGEHFGAGLTEREVRYFVEHEWARSADDVLWRRTKAGLHLDPAARRRVAEVVGR